MKNIRFLIGFLIVFMAACHPTAASETTTAANPTSNTGYAQVGDIKMYYSIQGSGEPLLLLHGGMQSSEVWSAQVPAFAQQYQVITPDSRGQGRTTDGDGSITYHLMAEDILKLMDILKINSAYIVGWSDGGNIGIDLALHHPERVKALVAYGANTTPAGLKADVLEKIRIIAVEDLAKGYATEYQRLSPTPDHLLVLVEKLRIMWLNEPNFTKDDLGSIHVPTLVLDGENEELIQIDHTKAIALAIPNAKLILLPNIGHHAPLDDAAAFNQAVLNFLKDY